MSYLTYPFLQNKYHACYLRLIQRCLRHPIKDIPGYTECHHILPRSLGGDDAVDNLVTLTTKEHFIAHTLLTHFTENRDYYSMLCAFKWMCEIRGRNKTNSRLYAAAKLTGDRLRSIHGKIRCADPIVRSEMSKRMIKVCQKPEHILKMQVAQQASWDGNDNRRKHMSDIQIARYADPNERIKQSERVKNSHSNPEVIAKISDASKKHWEDPDYRKNLSARRQATWCIDGYREKVITALKAGWKRRTSNPELLEMTRKKRGHLNGRKWHVAPDGSRKMFHPGVAPAGWTVYIPTTQKERSAKHRAKVKAKKLRAA